jgi:hypothetical protein
MFIWKNNFFSNNRRLSAFQLDVGPKTFDYHDVLKFNDERLRKNFREHFNAVIAQSVRVSSMNFFGSSNAVRKVRNDFPTKPRQPISKAKKRTVNPFSAIRFAKSWYFLVFVSCQYVMRASIGQVSSPIMMSLVNYLMRTISGLSFESKLRSVCRKSCRFLSRSAIS